MQPTSVDESLRDGEEAGVYLDRVVRYKLEAALALDAAAELPGALVADTTVVVDGRILSKPTSAEDALSMLRRLAGAEHRVLTRFALGTPSRGTLLARTVTTTVRMRRSSDAELRRYVDSGEGVDKAGAYAVQGLGAFLVQSIDGSYTNVVGLPACELVEGLLETGLLRGFPCLEG